MRRAVLASLTLVACSPCPRGEHLITYTTTQCNDYTRECVDTRHEECACDRAVRSCPHADAGPPVVCLPALTGTGDWKTQLVSTVPHVVDGRFTGAEWDHATKLEGLFTDVYMDYRDGRLYFLNDWRANGEGIRPDCFNYFQVRVGTDWIDLRVFGDGHVEVHRAGAPVAIAAAGAYGLGPSPNYPQPHTIYEFSLPVDLPDIVVCCIDPLFESTCGQLTEEPMAVSLRVSGGVMQVRRQIVAGAVARLGAEAACGSQQGICADGLECNGDRHVCALPGVMPIDGGDRADAGPIDAGMPY